MKMERERLRRDLVEIEGTGCESIAFHSLTRKGDGTKNIHRSDRLERDSCKS